MDYYINWGLCYLCTFKLPDGRLYCLICCDTAKQFAGIGYSKSARAIEGSLTQLQKCPFSQVDCPTSPVTIVTWQWGPFLSVVKNQIFPHSADTYAMWISAQIVQSVTSYPVWELTDCKLVCSCCELAANALQVKKVTTKCFVTSRV